MKQNILEAQNITKEYNLTKALDNVSLSIEKGKIYGFIGQNGSGKTTFMRIVAGLTFPDKGSIKLFGKSTEREMAEQRKRMGCIIETPSFYSYMSAYENLDLARTAKGIPSKKSIDNVLDIVGLQDCGKKKVNNFSLGMKQRLGIAIALLCEPEFLILDEPTNGLDAINIVEIRELLLRLVREKGITILVSSHILDELYQLATEYIFIHKGKIVQEISQRELNEKCKRHIAITVNDTPLTLTILETKLFTKNYKVMPNNTITLYDYIDEIQKVFSTLTENGLLISNIGVSGDSLENYFINLIGGVTHA